MSVPHLTPDSHTGLVLLTIHADAPPVRAITVYRVCFNRINAPCRQLVRRDLCTGNCSWTFDCLLLFDPIGQVTVPKETKALGSVKAY